MRVLTYNIHGWQAPDGTFNPERLAEVIEASGADLVGLNEVFHPYPTDAGPALDWLADRLGMVYAFGVTVANTPLPNNLLYGNAVLSRWPILAYAAHNLSPAATYGRRGLLEARILLPAGRTFTLYVTHLDHRSEDVRVAQWASARPWLARDRTRLHLLIGDFNALAATDYSAPGAFEKLVTYNHAHEWGEPSFDLIAQVLKAGYVDAFATVGEGIAPTWPAQQPERRIDYIFVPETQAGTLANCQRCDLLPAQSASDHLPVLAEIAA